MRQQFKPICSSSCVYFEQNMSCIELCTCNGSYICKIQWQIMLPNSKMLVLVSENYDNELKQSRYICHGMLFCRCAQINNNIHFVVKQRY